MSQHITDETTSVAEAGVEIMGFGHHAELKRPQNFNHFQNLTSTDRQKIESLLKANEIQVRKPISSQSPFEPCTPAVVRLQGRVESHGRR